MIVVAAQIDYPDRASRDAAIQASIPVQQATRDDEAGCHAYCFAADPCVDTRIQVYELWEDEASLVAHFSHPNYLGMRDILRGHGIVGSWNRAYNTTKDEAVYTAEGKTKEHFFRD